MILSEDFIKFIGTGVYPDQTVLGTVLSGSTLSALVNLSKHVG